jgi:hypothetical protein
MRSKQLMIVAVITVTALPIVVFIGVQHYLESIPYYYEAHFILGERDLRVVIEDLIEQNADFTAEFGESKVGHIHWMSEGVRFEIGSTRKNNIHDPKNTRVTGISSVNGNLLNYEEKLEKMSDLSELFPELQGKRYCYRRIGAKDYQSPVGFFNDPVEPFEIK